MSYFAEIENRIVKRVIVAEQEFINSGTVGNPDNWVETFANNEIRKNYASIGCIFDKTKNVFISPKPYNSWILDEDTCRYKAPKEKPVIAKDEYLKWDENKQDWNKVNLLNNLSTL